MAEAEAQAAQLRAEAEGVMGREVAAAEEAAARIVETARSEAAEMVEKARVEADAIRAAAQHEKALTIEGAIATRERILEDLSRRRRVASVQIEQLRAGRERLLESYAVVRRTLEEVNDELNRADAEARAAADEVGRRMQREVQAEPAPPEDAPAAPDPEPEAVAPDVQPEPPVVTAEPVARRQRIAGTDRHTRGGPGAGPESPPRRRPPQPRSSPTRSPPSPRRRPSPTCASSPTCRELPVSAARWTCSSPGSGPGGQTGRTGSRTLGPPWCRLPAPRRRPGPMRRPLPSPLRAQSLSPASSPRPARSRLPGPNPRSARDPAATRRTPPAPGRPARTTTKPCCSGARPP